MQITATSQQIEVINSPARYTAAIAGIQGGKTMSGVLWLMNQIRQYPKDDFLIAAPTYKILEQSTLKKFFEIFPMYTVIYRKQEQVLKLIPNGGNIYIRSTEIPNNIEGMTLRAAWLDEAGMMKPAVWTNIMGRVAIKRGKVLFTSTPYAVNWLYNEVERMAEAGDKDFKVIRWKSIDNPYFPKEEYERAKKNLHPDEFERRYHGVFRKMAGLVYPDFDNSTMTTVNIPDQFKEVFAGVDYGFTNPCAIEVLGLTLDDRLIVVDELYRTKLTIDEIVKEARILKGKWNIQYFYADPSAPSLIESMNMNGLPTQAADNDVDSGIDRVRQLIKNNRVLISLHASNLLDEIELYHYQTAQTDIEKVPEYKPKPEKEFDHAVDALRYAIATHPLEVFDVFIQKTEDKTTEYWKRVKERLHERQIRIDRYGEDYSEEDMEEMEMLMVI